MKKILSSPYGLLVAGVLFISCTYWIYKNVKLSDLVGKSDITEVSNNIGQDYVKKYEIRDNDVVEIISSNETRIIIKGNKIEGAVSLFDLSVSPDGKKLCFLAQTIVPIWLYVYDIESEIFKKVDLAKNCVWSPDSTYIAYNNHTTDVSQVDVKIYDVEKGEIKNLTRNLTEPDYVRNYSTPIWENGRVITVSYIEFKENNVSNQREGKNRVDVITGEELSLL